MEATSGATMTLMATSSVQGTDMLATDALTLAQDRDLWRAVAMASWLGAQ